MIFTCLCCVDVLVILQCTDVWYNNVENPLVVRNKLVAIAAMEHRHV